MRISKKNKGILDGQQKIKITKLYAGDYFGHEVLEEEDFLMYSYDINCSTDVEVAYVKQKFLTHLFENQNLEFIHK
jgi:hypothetical protein